MTDLTAKIRTAIAADLDRTTFESLGADAMTTAGAQASSLTTETLHQQLQQWRRTAVAMRRSAIHVVVDPLHEGAATREQNAVDGLIAICSYRWAAELHSHWPLILDHVDDQGRGWFRPANLFDHFIPAMLPAPPYELPPDPETPPDQEAAR